MQMQNSGWDCRMHICQVVVKSSVLRSQVFFWKLKNATIHWSNFQAQERIFWNVIRTNLAEVSFPLKIFSVEPTTFTTDKPKQTMKRTSTGTNPEEPPQQPGIVQPNRFPPSLSQGEEHANIYNFPPDRNQFSFGILNKEKVLILISSSLYVLVKKLTFFWDLLLRERTK